MSIFKKIFGQNPPAPKAATPPQEKPIPALPATSPELAKHGCTTWVWSLSDGEGASNSTRTGGRPIMRDDEIWPKCGSCDNPLAFKMQCDLEALPDEMTGHGPSILRFFYCLHDDCDGAGGWGPDDPQNHLSLLQGQGIARTAPNGTITLAAKYLSGLREIMDYPHWADRRHLDLPDSDDAVYALPGHKFGGWPHWIQGAERPKCPKCTEAMEPFIQLDNDWNREFNFGGGVGHISQCKTHTDCFAFGWACG